MKSETEVYSQNCASENISRQRSRVHKFFGRGVEEPAVRVRMSRPKSTSHRVALI